ncbi:MAG: Cna B-type domain-containing protein, partial [Erysipelotrichaceae bacterium]|nr:Cna B-type domain-containing protein [Erysipelotrichaceae bacterium]
MMVDYCFVYARGGHKNMKKLLTLLFALVICFGSFVSVRAEEDPVTPEPEQEETKFDVSGSKTADPTFLEGDERETTVTLSLPSAEYQNDVYILFTADTSSSISNNDINFGEMAAEMFADILEMNPNLEIHVGVLKFTGKVSDGIKIVSGGEYEGFVKYSDDLTGIIDKAIDAPSTKDYKKNPSNWPEYTEAITIPGRGSNLQGALDISEEWLDALVEKGVEPSKIYLVVLTDGKSYIWNNEKNEPVTYYTQYYNHYAIQGSGIPTIGQQTGARDKEAYPVQVAGTEAFRYGYATKPTTISWADKSNPELYQSLYDLSSDNPCYEEINNTDGVFDEPCFYVETSVATLPGENPTVYASTNGSTLTYTNPHNGSTNNKFTGGYLNYYDFTPEGEYDYLSSNPYDVVRNEDGSIKVDDNNKVTFNTEAINEDFYMLHPDSLQKSLYLAGHLWTDLSAKYNCGVVVYKNKITADDVGWAADSGLGPAASFDSWILENSQYAADILNTNQVTTMFSDISNDMLYMVSKGVVTDQITDDFTLKNADNENGFRMTLSGEALPVTYEDGKWNFGTAVDGVYPYVVEYAADTKTISWTINVPIENANPVTLSYDLILREDAESAIYPTNVSAILDYVSTDGKYEGAYPFEVPEVVYIKHIDIPVTKVWEDNDDEDGGRPDSITAVLLVDEEEIESLEINKDDVTEDDVNRWVSAFKDHPDSTYDEETREFTKIIYTLQEVEVANYDTEISGDYLEGFVITNTYNPPTPPTGAPDTLALGLMMMS